MAVLTFLFFLFVSPSEILKGTIVDQTGAAVAGARVEISGAGFSRTTTTNDTGAFEIDDASSGTYSLRVTASGFTTYTSSIESLGKLCSSAVDRFGCAGRESFESPI